MKIGSVVKLKLADMDNVNLKGNVEEGALATVVDPNKYPKLYDELKLWTDSLQDLNDFICIEWIKKDPRYKERVDGFYHKCRFEKVQVN